MTPINVGALWQEIDADPHTTGAVVRRLLPQLSHDLFIGQRRDTGHRFAQFVLFGPGGDVPRSDPSTRGLSVKLVRETPAKATIEIVETTTALGHQFDELLADLLELIDQDPGDGIVARVARRLLAWKEFFARPDMLSLEQAAGLFAELTVLSQLVLPSIGAGPAIDAWTGPNPASQDFQVEAGAIEVKSWRGTGPGSLNVSSERQLEIIEGAEMVVAFATIEQRDSGPGPTLGELIAHVDDKLSGEPTVQLTYRDKVLRAGWASSARDARFEHYVLHQLEYFHVTDHFPRITRSMLPVGVGRVSYQVDRSVLEPFLISAADAAALTGMTT